MSGDNHPPMREDLERFLEDPLADRSTWESFLSVEKGHGRREKRIVTISPDLREWFVRECSGTLEVFGVERITWKKNTMSQEIRYGITSLSAQQVGASALAALVRAHWTIEKRSHRRRDGNFCEDQSQVRTRHVPALLAFLNSTLLALLDLLDVHNVPAQMRRYNAHPDQALRLLFRTL